MAKLFNSQLDFKTILQYAFRDLVRSYKKISSIIITLFISLFILSSIITIEESLQNELKANAKALLGGDMEVDYNRVQGNLNLVEEVKNFATVSQMVELNTMVSSLGQNSKSIFTRIKTIDEFYPLYGEVKAEPMNALKLLNTEDKTILVNENIFKNLNLKINDIIKVQEHEFKVVGVVQTVPDIGGAFVFGDFALAGTKTLEDLNISTLGSFLNYEYKVRFDQGIAEAEGAQQVEELFKDEKKARIRYPENSASGLKRIINNFSQFLSLVSISAMLIAGIGIANTLLSFINQKNSSIAVQKALGILSRDIKQIYYLELVILLTGISLLAYVSSFLLVPFVDQIVSAELGLNLNAQFSLLNYLKVFLVGFLVIVIFSLPTINSIDQVTGTSLFRNVFQTVEFNYNKKTIIISLTLLTLLIALFTFTSGRPLYSLIYFATFFFCLGVFYFLSRGLILLLKKKDWLNSLSLKMAIKNITQSKSLTPITIMSLGLGTTLLLSLAFIGSNFQRELAKSIPEIAPDYFYLGIQNNQRAEFENTIQAFDAAATIEVVPMVSAGLVKINGVDPNTYIDEFNDSQWVIRHDRRVSWTNEIPKDNPLTAGTWWDENKSDQLQISLDAKVAYDFGVKIGDQFTLNIYGREIDGEVVNFRAVDYRDLSINFAMLLNPSYAETIPHEYLATVKFQDKNKFNDIQLLNKFPSISVIDISDYLSKVTKVLNQVFVAVTIISLITVLVGLVVISSAIIVQGKIKVFQNLIFKILGFKKSQIIKSSLIEFFLNFLSIILIALVFAVIVSKYVIEQIFELKWIFDVSIFSNVALGVGLVTLVLIIFTNLKYLSPKVYPLVRNE